MTSPEKMMWRRRTTDLVLPIWITQSTTSWPYQPTKEHQRRTEKSEAEESRAILMRQRKSIKAADKNKLQKMPWQTKGYSRRVYQKRPSTTRNRGHQVPWTAEREAGQDPKAKNKDRKEATKKEASPLPDALFGQGHTTRKKKAMPSIAIDLK